jgi:hypothetical protein
MGFLIPSALAFAALAIPIIIFYMLKLRRQPARVSSLFLWQQVIEDRQANAPWQRLRRNLLLLLQLLILALLVMALARPYFTVQARVQGNVALLLDASASMQATDVTPSRFAAAQEAALDLIERLEADDAVTLIAVEHTPRVLAAATTDRHQLRQTIRAARASNGPADWEAALALAAAHVTTLPEATIVMISDGAPSRDGALGEASLGEQGAELRLPAIPAPVEFISVGQTADNQGLVVLSLRDGAEGLQMFLSAANAASQPRRRRVEIQVDGQLFDARQLDMPARGNANLTIGDLPLNARQIRASLAGEDDLAVDDVAWVVRSGAAARVLVVSEGNLFLQRALALLPNLEAQRAAPDQELPRAHFDLTIFDRAPLPSPNDEATGVLPEGNLLFIAPPATTPLFEVSGVITRPQVSRLERAHPLLSYVELNDLHIAQAQAVRPPPWAQSLIEAQNGPLLVAGQTEGRRVAILTFDLHQSDLPLQIDFPILVLNLTQWLLSGQGGNLTSQQTLQAGQSFNLPSISSANALQVKTPGDASFTISPDQATFDQTVELGIYHLFAEQPERDNPALVAQFAVNLLDKTETDIQPRPIRITQPAGLAPEKQLTGRWEWWQPLLGLGLIVLFVEWWVYWRGEVR